LYGDIIKKSTKYRIIGFVLVIGIFHNFIFAWRFVEDWGSLLSGLADAVRGDGLAFIADTIF
jgi:hypothetical protein